MILFISWSAEEVNELEAIQNKGTVRPVFVQRLFVQGIFVQSIWSNPISLGQDWTETGQTKMNQTKSRSTVPRVPETESESFLGVPGRVVDDEEDILELLEVPERVQLGREVGVRERQQPVQQLLQPCGKQ